MTSVPPPANSKSASDSSDFKSQSPLDPNTHGDSSFDDASSEISNPLMAGLSCPPDPLDKSALLAERPIHPTGKRNSKNIPRSTPLHSPNSFNAPRLVALVKRFHAALLASSGLSSARTKRAEGSIKMALELMYSQCEDFDREVDYALDALSSNIEQKSLLREVISNCFSRRTGALTSWTSPPDIITKLSEDPAQTQEILGSREQDVQDQKNSSHEGFHQAYSPSSHTLPSAKLGQLSLSPAQTQNFNNHPQRRHTDQKNQGPEVVIVDVFALPVFGSVRSMSVLLKNAKAMAKLTEFTMGSGYISAQSDCVAMMKIPLPWDALNKPSLLNSLSSEWGYHLAHRNRTLERSYEVERNAIELMQQSEVRDGTRGFVLPGVRVWKGTVEAYNKTNELLNQWGRVPDAQRTISRTWWQIVVSQILKDAHVIPGSLMIRPPATPLVAQAQTLAWHLTQQLYERLHGTPFGEINFETVADNTLALRAYGRTNNRVVAQSDWVSLFDVTTSAEDFTSVLNEECDQSGPRTQRRFRQ